MSTTPVLLGDAAIAAQVGNTRFSSVTLRAFRLPLEDRCEDFGQVATYLGTLPGLPHAFVLDDHHRLETGRPMLVCGNTADMLSATRYAPYMRLRGEKRTHFGIFDCAGAPAPSAPSAGPPASGAGCC